MVEAVDDEQENAGDAHVATEAAQGIPSGKRLRVVEDTARHASNPQEVHGEERQVDAHERHPEVDVRQALVVSEAAELAEPEVESAEDREDRAETQHVVEVGDDIVGPDLGGDHAEAAEGRLAGEDAHQVADDPEGR